MIELVNVETSQTFLNLNSNTKCINEAKWSPYKPNVFASISNDYLLLWNTDTNKPIGRVGSVGELDCLAWSRSKENIMAITSGNDIRIYDVRKTSSAVRYITNAHAKKIYSIDWCWTSGEEILLSSSRDKNVKLWNFNMLNQSFMDKVIEDFPCWKAKFLPYGLCFWVIPTCQSSGKRNMFHLNEITNKYNLNNPSSLSTSVSNVNLNANESENLIERVGQTLNSNNNISKAQTSHYSHMQSSLLVCQITAFNEAKINKFIRPSTKRNESENGTVESHQAGLDGECELDDDMIVSCEFFIDPTDKLNMATWSKQKQLALFSLDLNLKELDLRVAHSGRLLKEDLDEDMVSSLNTNANTRNMSINNPIMVANNTTTTTTTSSRKSSFSDYGLAGLTHYGTPPSSNLNSYLSSRTLIHQHQQQAMADSTRNTSFNADYATNEYYSSSLDLITINMQRNLMKDIQANANNSNLILKSSSNAAQNNNYWHDFLKEHPKSFGAKFTGLPEQMIIFFNQGAHLSRTSNKENESETASKHAKRAKSNKHTSHQSSTNKRSQANPNAHNQEHVKSTLLAKVFLFDVGPILNVRRELAENYLIKCELSESERIEIGKLCEKNLDQSIFYKRYDIAKIWELIKFITFNNKANKMETNSLDEEERPWSCSIFGRSLVNSLIQNCCLVNDFQTAALIIAILKQHDSNMIKLAKQSDDDELLSLIDRSSLKRFDTIIKFYCQIMHKWGLNTKRVEMFEFLSEKPADLDAEFECNKRCSKCFAVCESFSSKCSKCNSFMMHCSICELPVNGLSIYCVHCGHGGHYDHIFEWFKYNEDCPSACGCRCCDYL